MNYSFIRCAIIAIIVGYSPVGANAVAPDVKLENEIVQAIHQGNFKEVSRLVHGGIDLSRSAALRVAVEAGLTDYVQFLIIHGADPNGYPKGSAITEAAKSNKPDILNYLLTQGADIDAEPSDSQSSLCTPLIRSIYYGKFDEIKLLIKYGAGVNKLCKKGNTPLHQAINYTNGNQIELISLMLESGADPDIKDGHGLSARRYAKAATSEEITQLIEKYKPARKVKSRRAKYKYSLDKFKPNMVEHAMQLRRDSIREVPAASGVFYYEGAKPEYADCKFRKEYRSDSPGLRILLAVCGNGPFDDGNLDETLFSIKSIYSMIGIAGGEADSLDNYMKDYWQSKTMRSVTYLIPLVGHGIEFVPTSIMHDSESNSTFIVQIAVSTEEFYSLPRVHDAMMNLYNILGGGE